MVSLPSWYLSARELAEFFPSPVILSREAPAQIPAVACSQGPIYLLVHFSKLGSSVPLANSSPNAPWACRWPSCQSPLSSASPSPRAQCRPLPGSCADSLELVSLQTSVPAGICRHLARDEAPHLLASLFTFRATRHRSVWFRSAQMLPMSCFHLPGLFPLLLK